MFEKLEKSIGYTFKNKELLKNALLHMQMRIMLKVTKN